MAGKTSKKATSNEKMGGVNDFTLVSGFSNGYRAREDITTLPPGVLVEGSQNVLTNTYQRIGIRKGYTLDGQSDTSLSGIGGNRGAMGTFDWISAGSGSVVNGTGVGNGERNMRAGFLTSAGNDGKLQYRYTYPDGTIEWRTLLHDLTSVDFNYVSFWDLLNFQTVVLMVNGESNIKVWNGAITNLASTGSAGGEVLEIQTLPESAAPSTGNGGYNYHVGDRLTISAGNNDAVVTVNTLGSGAVPSIGSTSSGNNYVVGDLIIVSGAGDAPYIKLLVTSVGGSGNVTGFTQQNTGTGYTTGSGIATTTNSAMGSGFTAFIGAVANGVVVQWSIATDADRGTGYSVANGLSLTGGTGTAAKININAVAGAGTGSITKTGTQTWKEAGFLMQSSVGNQLLINGNLYTYSPDNLGDTTTLFGVTPDPSGEPANSIIEQAVYTQPNLGVNLVPPGLPVAFKNDLIGTIDGRVFIGSLTSALIWISEPGSYTAYGIGTPSTVGSGFLVVTTSPPTAFIPQEEFMYIAAGHDEWYNISFTLSADLTMETININRLNTTAQQASQSQAATNKIANSVVFMSFEPIVNTFGRVDNILLTPQMTDYSFPIVNDLLRYNLNNCAIAYYRKYIYIAVPHEGLVLVYNMTDVNNPYWEAPMVMPISRFSIIDGDLYGHSSQVSETYKLFNGTNDNGFPILARANFSFNNYGTRSQSKGYNEFYVEGYISPNAEIDLGIQYDIDGCATLTSFPITGDDAQIVCLASDQASLGKVSLGKNPLGSGLVTIDTNSPNPKFRVIKTFPTRYFYEDQISFTSEGIDEQWEIISFGPQLQSGGSLNNNITQ